MNLADFLRQSPMAQQRQANDSSFNRDADLAKMSQSYGSVQAPFIDRLLTGQVPMYTGNPNDVLADSLILGDEFNRQRDAKQAEQVMNLMPVAGMLKAGSKMNPYLKGVAEGDELIGMHNLTADNLEHAHELGGLPVPSIGISKANAPLEGFGDISLIAKQNMVTPSRGNPVFGADAYSKRYPTIEYVDDVDKIFKGYTHGGKRRYADHTLDNIVKEMRGTVPNSEGFSYGAGSLRSELTPKFRNLKGIQKARDQVVPEKEMPAIKEEMQDRLFGLVDDLLPYDKHATKYEMGYGDTVTARLSPKERLSDYYDDIPPDLMDKINQYKGDLRTAPTAYFEAKPQRGVQLEEFGGAVVPDGVDPRVLDILKRHGINKVESYGGASEATGKYKTKAEAMQKFRDLMFSTGGTGFLASQLLGQDR